jgi:N-glycosidase YbiA
MSKKMINPWVTIKKEKLKPGQEALKKTFEDGKTYYFQMPTSIPVEKEKKKEVAKMMKIEDKVGPILFYGKKDPYYEFSNYFVDTKNKQGFLFNGKYYKTSEHAFQAAKFEDEEYAEVIRQATTPNFARILGNQKCKGGYPNIVKMNDVVRQYQHIKMKENWNTLRDEIMQQIVDAKFSQCKRLKKLLLDTKDRRIIEDSTDPHWGMKNGKGDNALGLILERTRERLFNGEL